MFAANSVSRLSANLGKMLIAVRSGFARLSQTGRTRLLPA